MWKKLLVLCLLGILSASGAQAGIRAKESAEQQELDLWHSIQNSSRPEDFAAYLKAYPQGPFAPLARKRLERLRQAAVPKAPPAPAPIPAPPPVAAPAVSAPLPAPAAAGEVRAKPPRKKARPAPVQVRTRPAAPSPQGTESTAVAAIQPPILPPVLANAPRTQDCPYCPTMIQLPGGLFTMGSEIGSPTEQPSHTVSLGAPFAISREEISVGQWNACAEAGFCPRVSDTAGSDPGAPAANVSWEDAQLYVQWLSRITGKSYRLPTEAEWEYAAQGSSAQGPGAEAPGLANLAGGLREWVSDCWHSSYRGAPPDGSAWEEPACPLRVVRGGTGGAGSEDLPVSARQGHEAGLRSPLNGFRVVQDLP